MWSALKRHKKKKWGISSLDVATAFLNAPMPEGEDEAVYVKPPALLEQFNLIKENLLEITKSSVWLEN